MTHENWNGFKEGAWQDEINVRSFIQTNYKEYKGDHSFLCGATKRTDDLMAKVQELFAQERKNGGVLDIDTETVSSLTSYAPGYIDKENEVIFGLRKVKGISKLKFLEKLRELKSVYSGNKMTDEQIREFFGQKQQ